VKIISCTPDELPKVLKEAEVMMQVGGYGEVLVEDQSGLSFGHVAGGAHNWMHFD
jgi:hypothetical protein